MSQYYNGKRTRNLYNPKSKEPFKISRSKIDLFLNCPRCFYIDRRLGVGTPPGFPFAINSAVDKLLKQEFDIHRKLQTKHPLLEKYGVDAFPAQRVEIDEWRENFKGVQFHHQATNLIITGAIDDLWIDKKGEYIVVDYKATSKEGEIISLDKDWQDSYKRQMEVYQWLLRKNNLQVSDTGYFVYCNGKTDVKAFDGKIEFDVTLISYTGNDSWVEDTVYKIKDVLDQDAVPDSSPDCDFCLYREEVSKVLKEKGIFN
jgi:CRISPR/Cas system-associated exonuclease Cas4 (RecB family)